MAKAKDFLSTIREKFGEDIVEKADTGNIDVISTGSISLDCSIGVGGIPLGRFTEIYGPFSSSKTSLCLSVAKNAISKGYKVLYVDAEQGLDAKYIRAIVGDYETEKLVVVKPDTAEDCFDICESGIASKEFNLIILDSIGGLSPKKEKEDDFTDANVALLPRLVIKFLRRNAYDIRTNNIAFVFVNQVRDSIGSYVKSYETPGGNGLKHYTALRIMLSKSEEIKQADKTVGFFTRYVIKKNKVGIPLKSYMYPFFFGKGIDFARDLVNFSEMLGILDRRGAYYALDGEVLGQGLVKTTEYLLENPEVLDKLKKMCYNITINEVREFDGKEEELGEELADEENIQLRAVSEH